MKKEKLDHKCIICGKLYSSCDNCSQIKTYTPWRTVCDTFEHYNIYLTIRSFQGGIITKDEAKKELQAMKITTNVYADWIDGVKDVLDEILTEPVQPAKSDAKDKVNATVIQSSKVQKKNEE